MTREALEKLIDDDLLSAFAAMDQLDWRSNYQSSYQELKEKWVDLPQGSSKSSFRSQLKTLLSLHFSAHLQPTFPETHLLTPPPFIPEIFLGRDSDLAAVYHKLFQEENFLLLVNGQGGIGKTTLAAKYWERYKSHYSHVAWVFAGDDLAQALLALAPKLKLSFPETMPNAERLPLLIQELCALEKPCLLIIDNANDLAELEKHYLVLRSCDNFHILLTSRITEFEQAARHAIQPLEQDTAIELFQRYYTRYQPSEEGLLHQILSAVGYNTLVIELLAKNLRNLNKLREQYSLQQLLQDLQGKGLLSISKSSSVNTGYQAHGALRQASPEAIIAAMYELGDLSQEETQLLCVFAVLPAERIELSILEKLLPGILLDEPLSRLAQLGWLDFEEQDLSFKISPVVQQIVRQQNKSTLKKHCQLLIDSLWEQLDWEGSGHYADYSLAGKLTVYAGAVIGCFKVFDNDIALLCEKVGVYHEVTGNLNTALFYFEQYQRIEAKLFEEDPQEGIYKDNLAISYSQLGLTHSALGNLTQALIFFGKCNDLAKELQDTFPKNEDFKNSLAISYSQLGLTNSDLGNLNQALIFFQKYMELSKELHDDFPENADFKNSLAISYSQLGQMHNDLGNLPQALSFFQKSNDLEKELHNAFPENVDFKNSLAISYSQLGQMHNDLGNLPEALTFFQKYNDLEKELHDGFPENVDFKNSLAISYAKLGMIHLLQKKDIAVNEAFLECHQLFEELHTQAPENIRFFSNYAEAFAISAALKQLKGENAQTELAVAQQHFEHMQQYTGSEYYAKKSALVAQMQSPDADLRALIIELSKF